ncbi:MAG TPA: peroxiredoxin-like family protein [Desulfotignum sp.]|nr:peroxiredoxin-like family protein [Desulfotignum sp.]
MELEALQEAHAKFTSLGATLLMISPQTKEHSRAFKEEKGLTMEILSDPGNSIGEKFGLVYTFTEELKQVYLQLGIDLEEYNSWDPWRLPLVARYIIDQKGIIQYAIVSADHTDRVEPEHTLKALEALSG